MNQLNLKKIFRKLPNDFSKHCIRDISLLSCSIFGESHWLIEKIFDVNFSATLWVAKNNLINFYRSEKEYFYFSKKIGEHYCKNIGYTKKLTVKLRKSTDWFDVFLKRNKTIKEFIKNHKIFFDNYRIFFVYHQAVNWGGNYLFEIAKIKKLNRKQKNKILQMAKILDLAYKYNELVVPKIEKYFRRLKINNLLYSEISRNIRKGVETRSLLFFKNKKIILLSKEATILENEIKKITEKSKRIRVFKGMGVSKGIFIGKVKLILNLNQLRRCQKNEVLVTTNTRPQYNKFIKMLGAVITDEGGMLSHASILAREFNIPCIVGTKIATKVLKDGDLVEVDADKGIIKKIK